MSFDTFYVHITGDQIKEKLAKVDHQKLIETMVVMLVNHIEDFTKNLEGVMENMERHKKVKTQFTTGYLLARIVESAGYLHSYSPYLKHVFNELGLNEEVRGWDGVEAKSLEVLEGIREALNKSMEECKDMEI